MTLLTTTIGAYPKPEGTPVPDWFQKGAASYGDNPTREWEAAMADLSDDLDAEFSQATQAVISD